MSTGYFSAMLWRPFRKPAPEIPEYLDDTPLQLPPIKKEGSDTLTKKEFMRRGAITILGGPMASDFPHPRDVADYLEKLWDSIDARS